MFINVPSFLKRLFVFDDLEVQCYKPFIASSLNMCVIIVKQREYYEREMEKRAIKTNPLGKDRNHNRYWWFRRDGRIFVESSDSKEWGYYSSMEEVSELIVSILGADL